MDWLSPRLQGSSFKRPGHLCLALVVGALIGVVSAASYLFVVDQPITAVDMDAMSHPGVTPLKAGATNTEMMP